ncbi:MAG: VCBS repeat-containing protein [Myxococcales bacterium]|nr:VCBS repeat-containing protein [Myxococcales bacterium]
MTTRQLFLYACACALLAACSDLRDLGEPTCGNGLIEPGEDCDSPLEHCDRCSIVCAASDDCNAITGGGYVCGPDLRCHAPAGTFLRTQPVHINVDAVRIADVSQPPDGFGDLLAKSSSAVTVAYGAADGLSTARVSVQAPTSQGPVTFAKLDGDETPDVLVPTPDGIAAFTFGFGTPAPYTWPQLLEGGMNAGQPLMAFSLDDSHVVAIGNNTTGLGVVVMYVAGGGQEVVAQAPLCGAQASDFSEARTAVAFAPSAFGGTHVMLAAGLGTGASSTGCVIAIDSTGSAQTPFVINEVARQGGFAANTKPVFAHLDGEAICPSLIAQPAVGMNLLRFPGASTGSANKPCRLNPSVPLVRKDTTGQVLTTGSPLGTAPLGGGDHAIVLTNGVFVYRPGASGELAQIYISDRVLDRTAHADLDADGLMDLVALGDSASDLDLLYQIAPAPGLYSFLRVRVPTAAPVSRMLTGDFDGNGRVDIAYVERVDAVDRLMIAYGTADRPLEGQLAGSFTNVFSVLAVSIPDSGDPFSVIDDLAVLYTSAAGEQLAILHGSPQRTMQAYYDPFQIDAQGARTTLSATIPGSFGGGRGGHDLMSLGTVPDPLDPNFAPVGVMYVTPTSQDGAIAMTGGRCAVAPGLMECDGVANVPGDVGGGTSAQLCLSNSSYTAWSVGGHDVVIGVDGRGHAVTIDSAKLGACSENTFPPALTLPTWGDKLVLAPTAKPRRVRSLDVFASDVPELGITFEPGTGQPASLAAVRTCELPGGVATTKCSDPATVIAEQEGAVVCTDLASGNVFPRSRFDPTTPPIKRDLLAVCGASSDQRAVFRISRFSDRSTATKLFDVATASDVEVGDISGDGIDDIVVIDHGAGGAGANVTVYVQCTSRNPGDCVQLAALPEEGTKP